MDTSGAQVPDMASPAAEGGSSGWRSLVLRVKRKRTDAVGEDVIAIEGSVGEGGGAPAEEDGPSKKRHASKTNVLMDTFANLAAPSQSALTPSRRLYLRRVETIEVGGGMSRKRSARDVDGETVGTFRQHTQGLSGPVEEAAGKAAPVIPTAAAHWVTGGKKRIRMEDEDGEQSIVVVDMEVRRSAAARALEKRAAEQSAAPAGGAPPRRGVRILDPAARALQTAIEGAFRPGSGADSAARLTECMGAVEQGADVNLQTQQHGLTALMAAAFHGDTRLVSRLLARGADATLLTNASTGGSAGHELKKAYDFAEDPDYFGSHSLGKPSALRETMMLLQMAELHGVSPLPSLLRKNSSQEEDFVVDVYCVVDQATDQGEGADGQAAGAPRVVNIPGLRFNVDEVSGNIKDFDFTDITFAYDSDWSDLGDDEDPDSNDERFCGNDYPEEEEDEESFDEEDSEGEMMRAPPGSRGGPGAPGDGEWEDVSSEEGARDTYGCEEFDFELDGSESDVEQAPGERRVKFQSTDGGGTAAVAIDGDDAMLDGQMDGIDDSRGEEWARMQRVQAQANRMSRLAPLRSSGKPGHGTDKVDYLNPVGGRDDSRALHSSGKVMKAFTREDPFQPLPKKTGALKKLWDGASASAPSETGAEGDGAELDRDIAALRSGAGSGGLNEKQERLKQMDERLGLVAYESNANEFDADGLPKYGAELSDDDEDLRVLRAAYAADIAWGSDGSVSLPTTSGVRGAAQTHNEVAYDSELDKSTDDEP